MSLHLQSSPKARRKTKFVDSAGAHAGLEAASQGRQTVAAGHSFGGSSRASSKSVVADQLQSSFNVSMELTSAIRGEGAEAKICESLETAIGIFTCRGMDEGKLKPNQDYACYSQPFAGVDGTALFIVCDGHGNHGDDVSQEVLNSLLFELEENADSMLTEPSRVIADSFVAVNEHLQAMADGPDCTVNAIESGACAVLAFMCGARLRANPSRTSCPRPATRAPVHS